MSHNIQQTSDEAQCHGLKLEVMISTYYQSDGVDMNDINVHVNVTGSGFKLSTSLTFDEY